MGDALRIVGGGDDRLPVVGLDARQFDAPARPHGLGDGGRRSRAVVPRVGDGDPADSAASFTGDDRETATDFLLGGTMEDCALRAGRRTVSAGDAAGNHVDAAVDYIRHLDALRDCLAQSRRPHRQAMGKDRDGDVLLRGGSSKVS